MKCSNQLSISNIEESYTILLENEVQQFATNPSRVVQAAQSYYTDIFVHKGSKKRTDFTIGTIVSANGITVTKSGSRVTFSVNAGTTITTDSGTFRIPITIDGNTFSKTFSWSCAKQGQTGASGTPGIDAKAVDITASSQIFKSTDGGLTFSPDTIKLTPTFQGGITFGKWQYSINGGTSWADIVSGQNGLTVTSGVLTIAKTCAFYTKDITSISFKCISNNAGYFDVVTVAKLYDVTDIEIGGRNLAEKTNQGITNWTWSMQSGDYTKAEVVEDGIRCCRLERGSAAQSGWSIIGYNDIGRKKLEAGKQYTISFEIRGSASVKFTAALLKLNGTESLVKQHDFTSNSTVADQWSKCVYVVTLKDQLPSSTDQVLYLTGMSSAPGSNYTFRNLKIENGNKATPWTPAPEDIQEQIETLETNITMNTSSIASVEVLVDKQQKQIDAKVEQADFTAAIDGIRQDTALANRGINKWLVETYPKSSLQTDNQDKVTLDVLWGKGIIPDQTLEITDGETYGNTSYTDNSILYGLTYVYFNESTKISTAFTNSNSSALYLNGKSVIENAATGTHNISLPFAKGWNILEVVASVATGTKGFKFTTPLSQHASCKSMNCHIARPTRRQTSQVDRIADINIQLGQITQKVSDNALAIGKKADGEEMKSLQSLVNQTIDTVDVHTQEINRIGTTTSNMENGFRLMINNVQTNLETFESEVNGAFKDGIIEESEANAIELSLHVIQSDKIQMENEYTTVYGNPKLDGTVKADLSAAKTNYNNKFSDLSTAINTAINGGKATESESAAVHAAFMHYKASIGILKQRFQEAIDYISTAKVDTAVKNVDEKFKNYTSTTDLKSQFTQKDGEIYQSVTAAYKTTIDQADELAKGLNKWIVEVYPKSGISSTVVPYPKEVLGISPSKLLEYTESSLSTSMNIGDYYIGHAQTYVKFSSDYNFATSGNSISLTTNGKGILYINGVEIKQTSSGSTTTISTGSFVAGWNVIEVWWTASTGNDGMRFSKNISSLSGCTSMNCYHNFSGNAYQKMTATEISSKVDNNDGTYSQTVQKANMMDWLIKSGTSSTNFTLTDRTATLISDYINLKGLVQFDGLDSNTKDLINNGNSAYSWTYNNGSNMNNLYSMVRKWTNNAVSDSTYIQGGWIATNTITADKIAIGSGANLYNLGYDTFDNITEDNLYYNESSYATVSLNTANVYYGKKSLCIRATGNSAYVYLGHSTNNYGCIPVQTGKYYRLSCYVKASSSATAYLYIVKHTGINNTNSSLSSTYSTVGTSWTRIELGFTVTSSYPYVSVRLQNNGGSGTSMYFDAIMIEEVSSSSQKAGPFKPAGVTIIDGGNIITESITADKIAAKSITADKIDVNSIFAQNITATGTIRGVNLIGSNITTELDGWGTVTMSNGRVMTEDYKIFGSDRCKVETMLARGKVISYTGKNGIDHYYRSELGGEGLSLSIWSGGGGYNPWLSADSTFPRLVLDGELYASQEIISYNRESTINAFRAIGGSYGFLIRNDGNATYFLLTDKLDVYGTFNRLRPLMITNDTGYVTIATPFTTNSSVLMNQAPRLPGTFSLTTAAGPNIFISSDYYLCRSTSATKYKLNIKPLDETNDYAYRILTLEPKQWFDKMSIENYSDNLTSAFWGNKTYEEKPVNSINTYYGLIAEDVEDAGLSKYCQYGADGELEGLMYDRLWTLLIPITRDVVDDVAKLKNEVAELKNQIQILTESRNE